ncbi:unnamed protein product [Linum trigynum]|uniref:Uncharacterized protein n=1 Tax=Linum trigynum TaxID=586398 RepID=A0AAV2D4T0_9ROSI
MRQKTEQEKEITAGKADTDGKSSQLRISSIPKRTGISTSAAFLIHARKSTDSQPDDGLNGKMRHRGQRMRGSRGNSRRLFAYLIDKRSNRRATALRRALPEQFEEGRAARNPREGLRRFWKSRGKMLHTRTI